MSKIMLSIAVLFGVVALGQCICPTLELDRTSMNNCGDNGERMEGDFVQGAEICEVWCRLPSDIGRVRFVCASGMEMLALEGESGLVDCVEAAANETAVTEEILTEEPTEESTEETTEEPIEEVTEEPTEEETEAPTEEVTEAPTEEATEEPSPAEGACPPNNLPNNKVPNCLRKALQIESKIVNFSDSFHCPTRCYVRFGYGGASFGKKSYRDNYFSCPEGYRFKLRDRRNYTYECVKKN